MRTACAAAWLLSAAPALADYATAKQALDAGDEVTARSEARRGAEAGELASMVLLGGMLRFGTGGPEDKPEAVRWLRTAAEQGEAVAQRELGYVYLYGDGVAQDEAQAAAWLRKAAGQGEKFARLVYASLLLGDRGIVPDAAEAVGWLQETAERGEPLAWKLLPVLMVQGIGGLPRDIVQAYAWLLLAESADVEGADEYLQQFEAVMTDEQLDEAEQRARAWRPGGSP